MQGAHPAAGSAGDTLARIGTTIDNEAEVRALGAWFARWGTRIRRMADAGCGCCLDAWDVQAPAEALAELPRGMVSAPRHAPPSQPVNAAP